MATLDNIDLSSFSYQDSRGLSNWKVFTPVFTGLTLVGGLTATGRFYVIGRMVAFQVRFSAATSLASTAGTSYLALPTESGGFGGFAVMANDTTKAAVGNCHIDVTAKRAYLPTQGASGNVFTLAGFYER